MSIQSNLQNQDNKLSKKRRIIMLLAIGIGVFCLQFISFYFFQIVFPYIGFLGLLSFIMAVLVAFSKENILESLAAQTAPRQINTQIILTSILFLVVGFVLLYISQFLRDWQFGSIGSSSNISIYEISLFWILASLLMIVFFSIKHFFIKK